LIRLCHYGDPGKPGWTEIKWNKTAAGLCYDVNLLGNDISNIKKNTQTLIGASKEVNTEKTKYMLLPRHQNAGQNHDIANRFFENMAQFSYLGTTVINQNLIQVEIRRRLNMGNAC
jgi:hypothetical protein